MNNSRASNLALDVMLAVPRHGPLPEMTDQLASSSPGVGGGDGDGDGDVKNWSRMPPIADL
jgi:hypothetical protein